MIPTEEKEVRARILQLLFDANQRDHFALVKSSDITEQLGLDEKTIARNAKYLEEKGYAKVRWSLGGSFIASISSLGIDEVESHR